MPRRSKPLRTSGSEDWIRRPAALCLVFVAFLVLVPARGHAALSIRVGNHDLLPNTRHQFIDVQVVGGDPVSGIDLFVQIGDGGPGLAEFGLPAGAPGPTVSAIDLKTGTIFAGVADLPVDLGSPRLPQVAIQSLALITSTTTVPAAGRLARLEIDTSGFFSGSWPLNLTGVLPFDEFSGPLSTVFPGSSGLQIQNGTIRVRTGLCDTDGDGRCDPLGDLNSDKQLDAQDIDALSDAIRRGLTDRPLDLNNDQRVNLVDRTAWVELLRRTYFGDANLNGIFDSADFVAIFQAGQYENNVPRDSGWATGDWNGDAEFNSSDLVLAFQAGGYDRGPRGAVTAVPEPRSIGPVCLMGLAAGGRWRRGRRSAN